MQTILLVDDAEELCLSIKEALASIKAKLIIAHTAKDAVVHFTKEKIDLFILDIKLPDGDGFELISKIRQLEKYRKTPILFLSSLIDIPSKISAFALGADDYVIKPFSLLELRARVETRLKKFIDQTEEEPSLKAGPLLLLPNKQKTIESSSGKSISLSSTEFKILTYLARRPAVIFSREQILQEIWGTNVHVVDRTVDTHIYSLRKKLGEHRNLLKSYPGDGYAFTSELAN